MRPAIGLEFSDEVPPFPYGSDIIESDQSQKASGNEGSQQSKHHAVLAKVEQGDDNRQIPGSNHGESAVERGNEKNTPQSLHER